MLGSGHQHHEDMQQAHMQVRRPRFDVDYKRAPLLVIWEVTRSCALACKHCRAKAIPGRDPNELSVEEGKTLIRDVRQMGTPIIVFTGGDPLQRDDLEDLIRTAKEEGLRVGTIPAATPLLTRERVESLKTAGVDQLAFSLDAGTPELHDDFRGVEGSFQTTINGVGFARNAGVPVQINTCFDAWNFEEFDKIANLVGLLRAVFWEIFFLVPVGRGTALQGLAPQQFDQLFEKIADLSSRVSFVIKVTEAQHYRRFLLQRNLAQRRAASGNPFPESKKSHASLFENAARVVNAGSGFCFVSHTGELCPSGFLPLSAGNIRDCSITELYRNAPLFRELRDANLLKGRCGCCEYKGVCGGSRSRAYALTGDYLSEAPCCSYHPKAFFV